jgi:hypothetical protein
VVAFQKNKKKTLKKIGKADFVFKTWNTNLW